MEFSGTLASTQTGVAFAARSAFRISVPVFSVLAPFKPRVAVSRAIERLSAQTHKSQTALAAFRSDVAPRLFSFFASFSPIFDAR